MIRFLAISIFTITHLFFDASAPACIVIREIHCDNPKAVTNWTIFYFVGTWLGILIHNLHAIWQCRKTHELRMYGYIVYSLLYLYYIGFEISKINMDYNTYMKSVRIAPSDTWVHGFIVLCLVVIAIDFWMSYLKTWIRRLFQYIKRLL